MTYKLLLVACVVSCSISLNAQDWAWHSTSPNGAYAVMETSAEINGFQQDSSYHKTIKFFIGYDLGEAIFNQFKSLGSEVGVRFKNNHLVRLAYTHLHLSEAHLSSDFARAVDGKHVEGKQIGLEGFYDFSVFVKGLYIAPSAGYYANKYTHTLSNETVDHASFTIGTAISFTETDVFKVKGLYYRLSIPLRINLDAIEETKLGDATINSNRFDNSIWFFVGYQF